MKIEKSNLPLLAWTEADELSVTRSELGRRRREENTWMRKETLHLDEEGNPRPALVRFIVEEGGG